MIKWSAQGLTPPPAPPGPPPDIDPAQELARGLLTLVDDLQRALAETRRLAGTEMARSVAAELPGAIDRLVLQRYRRLVLLSVLAMALSSAGGLVAGVMLTRMTDGLQCAHQPDGSTVCWRLERPASRPGGA